MLIAVVGKGSEHVFPARLLELPTPAHAFQLPRQVGL